MARYFFVMMVCAVALSGCGGPVVVDDPMGTLSTTPMSPRKHVASMEILDGESGAQERAYLDRLHRIIWAPGYTVEVREEALQRLEQREPEQLQRTIAQQLPRMTMPRWLERLCETIAQRGWVNQTPALVRSWSRRMPYVEETDRVEYQALAKLHGRDRVTDVVFETMVESTGVAEQGLRTRAWDLLHRLGERERLIALLTEQAPPADDAMLVDLHRAAVDAGITPHNREEILWLRKLLSPAYADFWSETVSAIQGLEVRRRSELEIRDLPVLVAAARHEPAVLTMERGDLYADVQARLRGVRRYSAEAARNAGGGRSDRLDEHREMLTWGDLAAMRIALSAMSVPEVRAHMFNYADRDHADETTEYGGVIQLDQRGRFEVLEFPPRVREHDQKFIASQEMLDNAYTAQFHFHLHAQRHRHGDFAGPGMGDRNYADNLRANCLVLTFVDVDTLNVDYYRHGGVLVDLGTISRAEK